MNIFVFDNGSGRLTELIQFNFHMRVTVQGNTQYIREKHDTKDIRYIGYTKTFKGTYTR